MSAVEEIIDFAAEYRSADLDGAMRDHVKLFLLDTLGAMYAGASADGVAALAELARDWAGRPQATLVVDGSRNSVRSAALVNGMAARGWDLDDIHEQLTCHVNASIVPAALAVAEFVGNVSGEDLLASIALGSEVTCRLAAASKLSFSVTGAPPSYHCTAFGAAVTASRLMNLNRDKTLHALGIAYACMAGNHQGYVDGAMTVRLLQGVSAETGVAAALMADRGITGAGDVLEGRFGYFNVYQRGEYDPRHLAAELGTSWEQRNISIKPLYPCCRYTHGPIEATIKLVEDAGAGVEDIQTLHVTVANKEVFDLVCTSRERKWRPSSVVDVQFSLPFTVAFAAMYKHVGFELLRREAREDERLLELTNRVIPILNLEEQGTQRGRFPMTGQVTLETKSGKRLIAPFGKVKGHPDNPMAFDEVAAKVRTCAEFGIPAWAGVDAAIAAIQDLEADLRIPDIIPHRESRSTAA